MCNDSLVCAAWRRRRFRFLGRISEKIRAPWRVPTIRKYGHFMIRTGAANLPPFARAPVEGAPMCRMHCAGAFAFRGPCRALSLIVFIGNLLKNGRIKDAPTESVGLRPVTRSSACRLSLHRPSSAATLHLLWPLALTLFQRLEMLAQLHFFVL